MGQRPSVPFLDLKRQHQAIRDEIDAAISRTIDSSEFVLGSQLTGFESSFASYCDCNHAIGVSSGTAALHLALVAMGIGPGDEVVTVPNTFVATVEAIAYTGATPVLVDVDPETYCMDPERFERAISPRTRAVIPVHIYGQPCDMESITAIAECRGIAIVEDACQAHGATINSRKMGSFGHAAAFSFYPTKNLGALGDGGAVTTNDPEIARKVKALRHHAQFEPNVFPTVGFNARLDSMQAAVLDVKLAHLDRWNARRREIVERYQAGVKSGDFVFQSRTTGSEPVYHILAVRHGRREAVHERLSAAGIGWGRHITSPIHRQPGYRHLSGEKDGFPVSESLSEELISLPVFPELTDEQVDRVVEVLEKVEVSV
ncbi:MAG: DegT/DnrJ/EryC1/StrS family aminotransferase [Candidatus Krumholzibacteriota bacterium]|nr:DegT/DnrJ/EryC1/StrS family aminotransferase [Candidatus Krumholzibacteriota bacterium]